MPLRVDFFARDTLVVARDLVGKHLVHEHPAGGRLVGRIVETEAYRLDDPACHAYGLLPHDGSGARKRGHDLFGPPGTAYIYLNYGVHWLLNVVTEPEGICGAVLIRAIEPLQGVSFMRARRAHVRKMEGIASGPGKLTSALDIGPAYHGTLLTGPPIYFEDPGGAEEVRVASSGRIGIREGAELPWRFFLEGSPYVSRGNPVRVNGSGGMQHRAGG